MTLTIDVLASGVGIDWFLKYVLELERLPSAGAITLESAEQDHAQVRVDTETPQRFLAEIFNIERYPADRMRMLADDQFEIVVNPGNLRVIEPPFEGEAAPGDAISDLGAATLTGQPSVADRILSNAATSARLRGIVDEPGDEPAPDRPGSWPRPEAYDRAREVINEAYETAAEIRLEALSRVREQVGEAERQAESIMKRGREDADRIIAQATAEAQLAMQRAQRDGDAIIAQARVEAERVARRAQEDADEVTGAARREAQEVLDSVTAALRQVTERQQEIEKMEADFHAVATQFMKWLGSSGRPQERMFRNVMSRFNPRPDDKK